VVDLVKQSDGTKVICLCSQGFHLCGTNQSQLDHLAFNAYLPFLLVQNAILCLREIGCNEQVLPWKM
jgi:hypothetical protein